MNVRQHCFTCLHSVYNNEPCFLPFQIMFTYTTVIFQLFNSLLWMHNTIQICLVQSYSKIKFIRFNCQIFYILFLRSKFLALIVGQVVPSLSRLPNPPLPIHLLLLFRSLHLLLETRLPAGSCNSTSQESGPLRAFRQPQLYSFTVLKDPFC
jgi:hypothetical protein